MLHTVITTIQRPTACVKRLATFLGKTNSKLIIAGDTKGPDTFDLSGVLGFNTEDLCFLSIEDQLASEFQIADQLPTKHYCRKNIGYLHAMRSGASCIYETDDDNAPLNNWTERSEIVESPRFVESETNDTPDWINVYKFFTTGLIWPRGLPLDCIKEPSTETQASPESLSSCQRNQDQYWAPIQQGLANGAPDVDAAWRLILDQEFDFEDGATVLLRPGQWCPFNTQTTWWWPSVYPLLYVPSYCSFRMCDIWKSFVAQRCLWELGSGVAFHPPEVFQERNPHNLMRDFEDEIPGYLGNHRLVSVLESVNLSGEIEDVSANLRSCYVALVAEGIFPEKELPLVDAWIQDVYSATSHGPVTATAE